jgi:predicted transposase YdaD
MQTDIQLYEIFCQHPEWIADLMNEPFPEPSTFRSITLKKVERRLDGLLEPLDQTKPLRVVEFQFFPNDDIYLRAVEQRIAVHRLYPGRDVEAIIFFAQRTLDLRPMPWTWVVNAAYLDEEMVILAERYPAHPLPKLLAPVFEKSDATLEITAPQVYKELAQIPGLTTEQRDTLQLIYTSLLLSRFKNKTIQEVTAMITSLDITKTRAGQELIAIGEAIGEAKGKQEGKAEGKAQTLLNILAKRLGKLPKTAVAHIEHLHFLQLEQLEELVLELPSIPALSAWLRSHKP